MERTVLTCRLVVVGVIAALLSGCGGSKAKQDAQADRSGCLLVQSRYSDTVKVTERWVNGNATNAQMLDSVDDLISGADYQQSQNRTARLKAAAADVSDTAALVYKAVNTGAGFNAAASQLADASRALNAICD